VIDALEVASRHNDSHSDRDSSRSLPLRPNVATTSVPDNSRAVTPMVPVAPTTATAPVTSRLEGQLQTMEAFSGLRDGATPRAPLPPPPGATGPIPRGSAEEGASNAHMPHVPQGMAQHLQRSPSNTSYLVCPQMVAPPTVAATFPSHLRSGRQTGHRRGGASGQGHPAAGPPRSQSTNGSMVGSISPRQAVPRGHRTGSKVPETHVTTSVVLSHLLQDSKTNKAPHGLGATMASMPPVPGVPGVSGAQQASSPPGLRLKGAEAGALVVKPPTSQLSPEGPVLNLEGGGMNMDPSASDVPYLMLLVPSTSLEGLNQQRQDSSAEPLWVEVGCRMISARFVDVNFNL